MAENGAATAAADPVIPEAWMALLDAVHDASFEMELDEATAFYDWMTERIAARRAFRIEYAEREAAFASREETPRG